MREIRQSGSEGGARQTNASFLPRSWGFPHPTLSQSPPPHPPQPPPPQPLTSRLHENRAVARTCFIIGLSSWTAKSPALSREASLNAWLPDLGSNQGPTD